MELEIKKNCLDSLKLITKIDSISKQIGDFDKLTNEKIIDYEVSNAEWSTKAFFWITLTGGVQSSKFYIYDSNKPFDMQIEPLSYVNISRGVLLNYYTSSSVSWWLSGYLGLGINWGKENNLLKLTQIEVSTTQKQSQPSTGTDRTVINKVNAYEGNQNTPAYLVSDYTTTTLQAIKFIDNNSRKFATGLTYRYKDSKTADAPYINIQDIEGSFIFQSQDSKKEKAIYNISLYLNFYDLNNSLKNDKLIEWHSRYELGLRVGLPFEILR